MLGHNVIFQHHLRNMSSIVKSFWSFVICISFIVVCYMSPLIVILRRHLSPSAIFQHGLQLFAIFRHRSRSLANIIDRSSVFVRISHCLSWFVLSRQPPSSSCSISQRQHLWASFKTNFRKFKTILRNIKPFSKIPKPIFENSKPFFEKWNPGRTKA